jgi:hypothetical protein
MPVFRCSKNPSKTRAQKPNKTREPATAPVDPNRIAVWYSCLGVSPWNESGAVGLNPGSVE